MARNPAPDGPEGFAEFVSARYAVLVRYGALLTGDPQLGEDLAQEGLVKTYGAWRRLHPDGAPEAYARRVMVRAAWRAGRRRWREVPTDTPPDRVEVDPYGARETAALVFAALRRLPAKQRVVLVLRYWGGLSEQEIAAELNCSVGTVKSRASRAVTALRQVGGPLADAFNPVSERAGFNGRRAADPSGSAPSGSAPSGCA